MTGLCSARHCVEYAEIRAFSDPYFPYMNRIVFVFSQNMGKYGYDSGVGC